MPDEGSVTGWINRLRVGDATPVESLWARYFPQLVGLARLKLQGIPARVADEEDVALSAFDSFCRHAQEGRFPNLLDRDGLWRLLVVITARKAAHLRRDEGRQKRGGGARTQPADADEGAYLEEILSREPTPDFAAQVAEECRLLLRRLDDRGLESLALLRMEGYTIEEIGLRLGYSPRSIKRKLQLIRCLWDPESSS
jgi:DNA-directed RNA polymerase specialized sigma24 family protein